MAVDPADRAGLPPEIAGVAGWLVQAAPDGTVTPMGGRRRIRDRQRTPSRAAVSSTRTRTRSRAARAGYVVADAGANALLMVADDGTISTVAVFPPVEAMFSAEVLAAMGPAPEGEGPAAEAKSRAGSAEAPAGSAAPPAARRQPQRRPAEGAMVPVPVQAVPTSVVVGPDGDLYMGQLTGGPFPIGGASVWRVPADGGEPTKYAEGFTNIIDIAFGPDGTLYVAEIVHEGLMGVFGAGAAPVGAVLSVPPGGGEPTLIVSDERVMAPGGIAVDAEGAIYVSTNTLPAGADGQLVKITL